MRKRLILFSLLAAGIGWGYLFYLCWAIGFAISKYCGGRKDGRPGRVRSIIIPWRRYELHLHHWFLFSLAGAISTASGFFLVAPELFYGFLSGLAFQGIYCYGDWHRIVKRKSVLLTLEQQMSLAAENDPEALDYYRYNEARDNSVQV